MIRSPWLHVIGKLLSRGVGFTGNCYPFIAVAVIVLALSPLIVTLSFITLSLVLVPYMSYFL